MPRKRSPDSTDDRQRIQFAYNADCDTPIGETFQYLLKSDQLPSRKGKHKGLDAIAAFWQPFAALENERLSEEERGAIAREAIESLTQQIDLIRETFGIEAPVSAANPAQLTQEMRAVAAQVIQEFVASGATSASVFEQVTTQTAQAASRTTVSQPAASSDEGVDFDEDALLGGLFDNSEIAA
jgi:hypothetical protein